MEHDRVAGHNDSAREVARPTLPASRGTDDACVVAAAGRIELEDSLDRRADVYRLDERSGRVPDAASKVERVRRAAIGR